MLNQTRVSESDIYVHFLTIIDEQAMMTSSFCGEL